MDCDVRDQIQATLIHLRAWEPKTSQLFGRILKPGDVAIDVGANIGYYSLLFAHLVGPKGKVVAIEALPRFAQKISEHVALNGAIQVRVVNAAVTASRAKVPVYEAPATNLGMTSTRADSGFTQSTTVDGLPITSILTPNELRRAALIKIDIEGAELPVMESILGVIDSLNPNLAIAVEISEPKSPEWQSVIDRMRDAGFTVYDLDNAYDWLELLDSPELRLKHIADLPDRQVDVLFSRSIFP